MGIVEATAQSKDMLTTRTSRSESSNTSIGVVHLVWTPLGIKPLQQFLDSYAQNAAGREHDLIVLFNGHRTRQELAPLEKLVRPYSHRFLILDKRQFDLASYFVSAHVFAEYQYLCFLNSYSRVLTPNWLRLLSHPVIESPGGVAAATGSWESFFSALLHDLRAQPFPASVGLRRRLVLLKHWWEFPPFPNPHIRTNGFFIERELLIGLRHGPLNNKSATLRFESGRASLTRQVRAAGRGIWLVGKNGQTYEVDAWATSGTFRQSNQENLLIADNRTDHYVACDAEQKELLRRRTWGCL
jgi:hypothetical protein